MPGPSAAPEAEALTAIEHGKISVEELLSAALRPGFHSWLTAAVKRSRAADRRAPQIRRRRQLSPVLMAEVLAAARRRLGRPGVITVSWGTKYRRGVKVRGPALVVWVRKKGPPRRKVDTIKETFTLRVRGRTLQFPTDVQEVPRASLQAGVTARPGLGLSVHAAGERGTLSAVRGTTAFLSGHVARASGTSVEATLLDGSRATLGKAVVPPLTATLDAACVPGVTASLVDSLGGQPVALRDLDAAAHDIGVTVNCVGGDRDALVDAVGAPADFGSDGAMVDVIRLDRRVTDPGDSGAPVVDALSRLIGFVLGASVKPEPDGRTHTYVIPADRVLAIADPEE